MKNGKITEVYTDSYFNTKKVYQDIQTSLTRILLWCSAGLELENKISDEYILRQDFLLKTTKYSQRILRSKKRLVRNEVLGISPVTPDNNE
jgi:hypothetical protein